MLILLWPAIVPVAILYMKRKMLTHKLLFLVIAMAASYAAMAIGGLAVSYGIQIFLSSIDTITRTTAILIEYVPTGVSLLLPVGAAIFVGWLFRALPKNITA
jgi:hypothetical protein